MLLFTGALWYEGHIELSLPMVYKLTVGDAFLWGLYSIIGFILICIITNTVEQSNNISETSKPFVASVLNSVVTIATYLTINLAAVGIVALYGFPMVFTLVNGGIVGASTYFHVIIPKWKKRKSNHPSSELEALKLEHNWIWNAIHTISWATLIILVSAWLLVFSQISVVAIPIEKRLELGFLKIIGSVAFQAMYACSGLFFGIIVKLWSYSTFIRERVSELELNKNP
jgi:hypothetical protein